MKIINNTEINNLILYAKKNLGIYRLVYKYESKMYWLSIIFLLISALILLTYPLLIIFHVDGFYEKICVCSCLFTCICSLIIIKYIDKKTKCKHLKIQETRYKLLKRYYRDKNYTLKELKVINSLLEKRKNEIEKQKITILVVFSILVLPIWDIFVQSYFNEFTFTKISKFAIFLFVFSIIVLFIVRFFNKTLYLYEENFYVKNNIAIIENLIYLNEYLIQEKEEQTNNGRRM